MYTLSRFQRLLQTGKQIRAICSVTSRPLYTSNKGSFLKTTSVLQNPTLSTRSYKKKDEIRISIFNVEDQEDFNNRVLASDIPVIVDFHAEWCNPCKFLGPDLEKEVIKQKGKVALAKVDIDDLGEIAMDYEVQSVPTVIGMIDGEEIDRFIGQINKLAIRSFIDRVVDEQK